MGRKKRPFLFGMKDEFLFAFAGLWDRWKSPEGTLLESCTILTTAANSLVADLHDRMPVILTRQHYETWLVTPPAQASGLADLLMPLDADLMRRYEVSSVVNCPKNDISDCIAPSVEPVS